jgi:hypothetical protein
MATIKGSWKGLGDCEVSYEITDEMKDRIIFELLDYYKQHGYCAEIIGQDDDAQIEAPNYLANICDDIIKFNIKYTEDEAN